MWNYGIPTTARFARFVIARLRMMTKRMYQSRGRRVRDAGHGLHPQKSLVRSWGVRTVRTVIGRRANTDSPTRGRPHITPILLGVWSTSINIGAGAQHTPNCFERR